MSKPNANLRPALAAITPDDSGPDPSKVTGMYKVPPSKLVLLGRNENPYPPSPKALDAMRSASTERYPSQDEFVKAAAIYTGFPQEQIIAGAGLDGLMDTLSRLFLDPGDRVVVYKPTYTYYELISRLCSADPVYIRREPHFEVPSHIPDDIKLVFLCSPNNPTGNTISEDTLRGILESTQAIVFLDEAYCEFSGITHVGLVSRYQNLVVGRTLSKAFSLAGLRLGYAVAPHWIAEQYRRIAPAFEISSPSLSAGAAALGDIDHMRSSVSKIISERERLRDILLESHPSEGNFIYIDTNDSSGLVATRLLKQGVVVKDCSVIPGAGDHSIRVTVGRPEDNEAFLGAYLSGC